MTEGIFNCVWIPMQIMYKLPYLISGNYLKTKALDWVVCLISDNWCSSGCKWRLPQQYCSPLFMAKYLPPGGIIYLKPTKMPINTHRILWRWTGTSTLAVCDIMGDFKSRHVKKFHLRKTMGRNFSPCRNDDGRWVKPPLRWDEYL